MFSNTCQRTAVLQVLAVQRFPVLCSVFSRWCSDCTTSHVSLSVIVTWSCTVWVQSCISQIGVTWPRNDSLLVYVSQCHKHCYTPLLSIATPTHSYTIYISTFICTIIIILVYNYNIIGVSLQLLHMRGRYSGFGATRFAYAHTHSSTHTHLV